MILIAVKCPTCGSTDVVRYGKQPNGEQRYRCNNAGCERKIFLLHYDQKGRRPEVKKKILDMAVNGSGFRDTARVLDISPVTVIKELKKQHRPSSRSILAALEALSGTEAEVILSRVKEAEVDEMWSFVECKDKQRWLWQALDQRTGTVLAYVLGKRQDQALLHGWLGGVSAACRA